MLSPSHEPSTKERGSGPPALLTRVQSYRPSILSKRYWLNERNELAKRTSAQLVAGRAEPVRVGSLAELAALLLDLGTHEALIHGVASSEPVGLVTREEWLWQGRPADPQPRTKEAFRWTNGPGVLLLDYDPDGDAEGLGKDQLVDALPYAVPGLYQTSMLWWPSASSHIYHGETNLTGLRGQRLYMLVRDASDIPRAGEALVEHLWAAGYGYCQVSKSGALLERTLVDSNVWQTNRLDFAAGAACDPPLEQCRGEPEWIEGKVEFVDTAEQIPDPLTDICAQAQAERTKARNAKREEAKEQRKRWQAERVASILERTEESESDEARERVEATVRRAVENGTLMGDFDVTVIENGERLETSVGAILDEPERFHGQPTLDPLEPEYDGGRAVGKLFLFGSRPNLWSFAHGGRNFRLARQPSRIELARGQTHAAVNQTLDVLKAQPDVFDFGNALVLVERGRVHPLDESHLGYYLGEIIQYWRWRSTPQGRYYTADEDPPANICKTLRSLGERRGLQQLEAIITAPTLRPDGSLITAPGYDAKTGLLLESDEPVCVPLNPSLEQVASALDRLLYPFKDFPLTSPLDWSVLLAGLLTAVVRASLPTAPGFGFDAPQQGAGKTLLARCLVALATGETPTIWPHTADRDDEEVRKRLFTALRSGTRGILWDNVVGIFQSASLASALTAPTYQDRVLGSSEAPTVPNKALFLLTGNNLCLAGDLPRRLLTCRIDPEHEQPFAREFDLDPEQYVQARRQELAEAALILIRGWLSSGDDRVLGRMASFEEWDDWVRQTVAWLGRRIRPGEYPDPMEAVTKAQASDPAQEALYELLAAWREAFSDRLVTARQVWEQSQAPDEPGKRLNEAIQEALGDIRSGKALGKCLGFRKDRIVSGLKLEERPPRDNTKQWRVVAYPSREDPTEAERAPSNRDEDILVGPWARAGQRTGGV